MCQARPGFNPATLYVLEEHLNKNELTEILPEYQADNAYVFYHYPRYTHPQPKIRKFIAYFL